MKQALLYDIGKFRIEETEPPVPGEHQVLVEVWACGICGSDLHIYHGDHPAIRPPAVMGHEFSGRVAAVGDRVRAFAVGDTVAGIPGVGCGNCAYCREGRFNRCRNLKVIGGHFPGAFAQYVLVPEDNLVRVPEGFTPIEGAMIESVAVAVHAVHRMGEVAGKTFLVLGAGPIGNLTVQVLKAFGARTVIASDPLEYRRFLARRMGADEVVDPIREDLEARVRQMLPDEDGLDGAFDCAGLEQTLTQALAVTKNGARIVLTAIFGINPTIPMRLLQRGERELIGVQMYVKSDFDVAVQLMEAKKVRVLDLVTRSFPLERIDEAFQAASGRSGGEGKIIVFIKA